MARPQEARAKSAQSKVIGRRTPGLWGPREKWGSWALVARVHEGDGDQCQTDFQKESMVEVEF